MSLHTFLVLEKPVAVDDFDNIAVVLFTKHKALIYTHARDINHYHKDEESPELIVEDIKELLPISRFATISLGNQPYIRFKK